MTTNSGTNRDAILRRLFGDSPWEADDDRRYDEYDWMDDDDYVRPALGLSPQQVASLTDAIDLRLTEQGCDNTLRAAEEWARREGLDWSALGERLRGRGGYCDCEVVFNAFEPD